MFDAWFLGVGSTARKTFVDAQPYPDGGRDFVGGEMEENVEGGRNILTQTQNE